MLRLSRGLHFALPTSQSLSSIFVVLDSEHWIVSLVVSRDMSGC